MSDRVRISIKNGVADVRLNRPEKMNALDSAMFEGLIDAGLGLAKESALRAVVLSGQGRAFCAGLDMNSFMAMASGERKPAADRDDGDQRDKGGAADVLMAGESNSPANRAQRAAWIWRELPVPVIAAIHGVAYGGGLQVALGADIRIVAPDARMSVMEIKWGLIPDMSGTQTLRHLVRDDVARDLTFSGRVVNGEEAVQLGLATRVSESPLDEALELAETIASKSPDAIRAAKRLLGATPFGSVQEGLQLEAKLQARLIGSPNQVEAAMANLQKRPPEFKDPS